MPDFFVCASGCDESDDDSAAPEVNFLESARGRRGSESGRSRTPRSSRSPAAADRLAARFSERFDELQKFPFIGPDRSELRESLRGVSIDGHVAFYLIETDRIVIVRVLDGRRDIKREFSK